MLIIVTINTKTVTYAPTARGLVSISNTQESGNMYHELFASTDNGTGQPYAIVNVNYSNEVTFGKQIGKNPPLSDQYMSPSVYFSTKGQSTESEQIYFSVDKAVR